MHDILIVLAVPAIALFAIGIVTSLWPALNYREPRPQHPAHRDADRLRAVMDAGECDGWVRHGGKL